MVETRFIESIKTTDKHKREDVKTSNWASPNIPNIKQGIIMSEKIKEFRDYRQKMNEKLLSMDNKIIKRIYNIDTNTYMEGALSSKVKEMLGLVSSMVLRCDDCVRYHLEKCFNEGVTKEELGEIFSVANLVGGTIVIPHTRRALEYWEELEKENTE